MPEGFLSIQPFAAHDYDALLAAGVFPQERIPSPQQYAFSARALQFQRYGLVYRVWYASGPHRVTGILVTPIEVNDKSHPIILFNRGGYRAFGMNTAGGILRYLLPLSRRNSALVFASQYREADGSEGKDEYGGGDVEDVLALLRIARGHHGWDGERSVMMGWSRGTLMTYCALKQGAQVAAAVCVAGVTDLWAMEAHRPIFRDVFRSTMPDYDTRREEHYRERSALCWPQKLTTPLLLMHGDADVRAKVEETERLAEKLSACGLPHSLVLYPGDDHGLNYNLEDVLARTGEWMERYKGRKGM